METGQIKFGIFYIVVIQNSKQSTVLMRNSKVSKKIKLNFERLPQENICQTEPQGGSLECKASWGQMADILKSDFT